MSEKEPQITPLLPSGDARTRSSGETNTSLEENQPIDSQEARHFVNYLVTADRKELQETLTNLRILNQSDRDFLSETLQIQGLAETTLVNRLAQQFVSDESLRPIETESLTAQGEIVLKEIATSSPLLAYRKSAKDILERLSNTTDYLKQRAEAVGFINEYLMAFGLYVDQYALATGVMPSGYRQLLINITMGALSLRSPKAVMDALCASSWKERKRTDAELHYGERSSYPMIFEMGSVYQKVMAQPRNSEGEHSNQNQAVQFGLWLRSLAEQWRQESNSFFDRPQKDTLTVLYLHRVNREEKSEHEIVPIRFDLDLKNLPTTQDLIDLYSRITNKDWSEAEELLDAAQRTRIRTIAYKPEDLNKKSPGYQKLASGTDVVVQFHPDSDTQPEHMLQQLESPDSLFINFNQAVFHLCLGLGKQNIANKIAWKTKHYEVDGVQSRAFFERMSGRVIKNAQTISNVRQQDIDFVAVQALPETQVTKSVESWIKYLPQEIWASTLIGPSQVEHLNSLVTQLNNQEIHYTSQSGRVAGVVKTSLPRVLAQARIVATRPKNTLFHFMTQGKDLDVATLSLPLDEKLPVLYRLLESKKAGDESAVRSEEKDSVRRALWESTVYLRRTLDLGKENRSVIAVLSAVANPAEELLQSTANVVGGDGFGTLIKGGGMISSIDTKREYVDSIVSDLLEAGIAVTTFDEDVTRLVLFGTANATAYMQAKPTEHGGVQGLVKTSGGLRLTDRYAWNQMGSRIKQPLCEQLNLLMNQYFKQQAEPLNEVADEEWAKLMQALDDRGENNQRLIEEVDRFHSKYFSQINKGIFVGLLSRVAQKVAQEMIQDQVMAAEVLIEAMSSANS